MEQLQSQDMIDCFNKSGNQDLQEKRKSKDKSSAWFVVYYLVQYRSLLNVTTFLNQLLKVLSPFILPTGWLFMEYSSYKMC